MAYQPITMLYRQVASSITFCYTLASMMSLIILRSQLVGLMTGHLIVQTPIQWPALMGVHSTR